MREWIAPGAHERMVSISVRPEFLIEHFLASSGAVPSVASDPSACFGDGRDLDAVHVSRLRIVMPAGGVVFCEQSFFRFACAADPLLTAE
jgi:hypothetical protein